MSPQTTQQWTLHISTASSPSSITTYCTYCSYLLTKQIPEIRIPSYATSQPTCKLCSQHINAFITLKTSTSSPRVLIPTLALARASEYFFSSLTKGWKEARSGIYIFPGFRIQDLRLFSIYTRGGDVSEDDIRSVLSTSSPDEELTYTHAEKGYARGGKDGIEYAKADMGIDRLVNCYLLGEYFQAPGFCNAVMDQLTPLYKYFSDDNEERVPLWNLALVFSGLRDSGLQRFVADVLKLALCEKTFRLAVQEGLVSDVVGEEVGAAAFRDRESGFREMGPWFRNACTYHDHPKGLYNSPCQDGYSMNGKEVEKVESVAWVDTYREPDNPDGW